MAKNYDFQKIELKWQKIWEEKGIHKVFENPKKPKKYILEMFPYPSGPIHMGHVRNYTIGDVVARYFKMKGFNVLHPIGWDAFGLPAENAAIERGVHPRDWTFGNISIMKNQLIRFGFSYDWDREVNTCEPNYYKWGQWIFLKFLERGLVYRRKAPVNWCPGCQTVLANEQVVKGLCWRCDSHVEKKELEQWFFKITEYAERLLNDLNLLLGWPKRVLLMQNNWIGRSEGAEVYFKVKDSEIIIPIFTTRPDTLYGVTFFLLAPEHPLVDEFTKGTIYENKVIELRRKIAKKSLEERTEITVEKEGCFIGKYAVNPLNGEEVPIWIANYVLMEYGTGAIMAVPAHDERDFDFAHKYNLPIKVVIQPEGKTLNGQTMKEAYVGEGIMVNSGQFSGLYSVDGVKKVISYLEEKGIGKFSVSYRIRDWLISRQRYWGNPIPIIYCDNCGIVPVPEKDLPVVLPLDVKFTSQGGNPLSYHENFVKTICPNCASPARRETDTMDTFTCSSWYFLRYTSPHEEKAPFSKEACDYWMPVDQYIGGIEHAVMHLLYSRFFTKVFYDMGLVKDVEPFTNLLCQGMVIKDGAKMSKSKGNVVDPEDIVSKYGADTARLFILFTSPPEKDLEWSDQGVEGSFRFLKRVWHLVLENIETLKVAQERELDQEDKKLRHIIHRTIKKVSEDIERRFNFNTAISAIMEMVNAMVDYNEQKKNLKNKMVLEEATKNLLLLLAPFIPHITEELWQMMGEKESIHLQSWPSYNEDIARAKEVTLVVQINGKVRDRITVEADISEERMKELALSSDKVKKYIEGKEIIKVLTAARKLVSIVVK